MTDLNHDFFSNPVALAEQLDDLFERLKGVGSDDGASGVFTSSPNKMQGYVVSLERVVGVWADRSESNIISRAVFYIVRDEQAVVEEFEGVEWSYWDLVEKAKDWEAG
jgi:hypothetical protein